MKHDTISKLLLPVSIVAATVLLLFLCFSPSVPMLLVVLLTVAVLVSANIMMQRRKQPQPLAVSLVHTDDKKSQPQGNTLHDDESPKKHEGHIGENISHIPDTLKTQKSATTTSNNQVDGRTPLLTHAF